MRAETFPRPGTAAFAELALEEQRWVTSVHSWYAFASGAVSPARGQLHPMFEEFQQKTSRP
jgi:hypothetical protein